MDEIMNNGTTTWNTSTNTTDSATLTFGTTDTCTTWFPYFMESTWLPYNCEKYYPVWHLLKSYGISKNQYRRFEKVSRFWALLKEYFV